MKTLYVVLTFAVIAFAAVLISACDSTVTNSNNNTQSQNFSIPAWDYAENFYFVDTLYRRSFKEWQDGVTSGFIDSNLIRNDNTFEVWVQCDATTADKRLCVGKVMLGERPPQGYDTSVTNPVTIMGDKFAGYFRKLNSNEFTLKDTAGFVVLRISIPENFHVGVVYTNHANKNYGKGLYNSSVNDTLILKLIKVDNQSPDLTPLAWQLKMKNVYRLSSAGLVSFTSSIFLKYNNLGTLPFYTTPLITMLKLDRVNNITFLPPPDGLFDWSNGITIFTFFQPAGSYSTYIMFPILEPFGQGLQEAGVTSEYWFNEIYTQRKTQAQINVIANMYKLMGTIIYF